MLSNTSQMTSFLSGRQRIGALCVQHSPTAAALSTNTAYEWIMWFSFCPVLLGSAEAQVIWGGILKHLLIAYFIDNISAEKNIKICSCVSKLLQTIGGTFFWDTVYVFFFYYVFGMCSVSFFSPCHALRIIIIVKKPKQTIKCYKNNVRHMTCLDVACEF